MLCLKALPKAVFAEFRRPTDVLDTHPGEILVPPIVVCHRVCCRCKILFTGLNSIRKTTLARVDKIEEEVFLNAFLASPRIAVLQGVAESMKDKSTDEELVRRYIQKLSGSLKGCQPGHVVRTSAHPPSVCILPWYWDESADAREEIPVSQDGDWESLT